MTNIVGPDGNLVTGYGYDEFGNQSRSGDGSFLNEVTFTGSVSDASTGLQYMNARFYQPTTGRFLSQDSYTGNAYDPWTQHLYSYCMNNPTNFIDPTGHSAYIAWEYMRKACLQLGESKGAHLTKALKYTWDVIEKQKAEKSKQKTDNNELRTEEEIIQTVQEEDKYYIVFNSIVPDLIRDGYKVKGMEVHLIDTYQEYITPKDAYNKYRDICEGKRDSIDHLLNAFSIVDKTQATYLAQQLYDSVREKKYNGDYYDKLGGVYSVSEYAFKIDWDLPSGGGGGHFCFTGVTITGPNVELYGETQRNPLNSAVSREIHKEYYKQLIGK